MHVIACMRCAGDGWAMYEVISVKDIIGIHPVSASRSEIVLDLPLGCDRCPHPLPTLSWGTLHLEMYTTNVSGTHTSRLQFTSADVFSTNDLHHSMLHNESTNFPFTIPIMIPQGWAPKKRG